MFHCVNRLKINGYKPHVILDIGAHRGFWTEECKKIFIEQFPTTGEALGWKNETL